MTVKELLFELQCMQIDKEVHIIDLDQSYPIKRKVLAIMDVDYLVKIADDRNWGNARVLHECDEPDCYKIYAKVGE